MMLRTRSIKCSYAVLSALLGCVLAAGLGCGGASQGETGPTTPGPAATAQQDEPEAQTDESTTLDILSDPTTEVRLDGKPIGSTPLANYKVTPGSHDVTFVDEVGGDRTMSIVVQPGDHQTVKSDRPPSIKESAPAEGGGKKN